MATRQAATAAHPRVSPPFPPPVCGNEVIESGEQCDDGNTFDGDYCTSNCKLPSCGDGFVGPGETCDDGNDVDEDNCPTTCILAYCGDGFVGPGEDCDDVNADDSDGCYNDCSVARTCAEVLDKDPNAGDGIAVIDPDGEGPKFPMEVFCKMSIASGGWTLVFVASDDAVNTWTWNDRARLASEAYTTGDLSAINEDFMSWAYHELPVTDILFIHQPSDVWAHYADVGDGVTNMGQIVAEAGSPVCDYALNGNGYELSGGTLTAAGALCDTDLYFNLGDHEVGLAECMDLGSNSNTASFGPVWSADQGAGCPFDDPAEFGLGPHGPCGACPPDFASTEFNYLGYGNALNLNDGAPNAGENYMQMYIR